MKISSSGKNLNIVIVNKASVTEEWMTFASWYSFHKNAPNSKVTISIQRSSSQIHQLFNWANRVSVNYAYYTSVSNDCQLINKLFALQQVLNKKYTQTPLLVVEPDIMLTDQLNTNSLNDLLNENKSIQSENGKVWFITDPFYVLNAIDKYFLEKLDLLPSETWICSNAQSTTNSLVCYEKGCGRFVTSKWIDKIKGCPFGKASRFKTDSLSVNEKRILDLWKKLAPLYKAIF